MQILQRLFSSLSNIFSFMIDVNTGMVDFWNLWVLVGTSIKCLCLLLVQTSLMGFLVNQLWNLGFLSVLNAHVSSSTAVGFPILFNYSIDIINI